MSSEHGAFYPTLHSTLPHMNSISYIGYAARQNSTIWNLLGVQNVCRVVHSSIFGTAPIRYTFAHFSINKNRMNFIYSHVSTDQRLPPGCYCAAHQHCGRSAGRRLYRNILAIMLAIYFIAFRMALLLVRGYTLCT